MRFKTIPLICGLLLAGVAIAQDKVPNDLVSVVFSGPEVTPSPASMCVAPTGEVFVGVDMNGSLGKGAGKGMIVRLRDSDVDGVADSHTEFAKVDSVRGLISLGKKVWALHTTYHADTDKASGMDLVVFEDQDWDGVADGPSKVLIKGICSETPLASRGTDHSTNGIRMGIDGWIYIAVGDFGFSNATAADGATLTLLGGGIVRVRPDGTEMELYTKGLRNIYDVAIDPFMNIFTRGNTNDGGGWNVRFIDQIQSSNYGYPSLFMNFGSEILPALEDVGGGSGVGALFMNEPSWAGAYNNQPMMADWGRNEVFIHRLEKDGPTFTQTVESFITLSQVTDLDVDASGRLYLSAWDGATFKGSSEKGYVIRVVPVGWEYEAFEAFDDAKVNALMAGLASESGTIRLAAQYELLTRKGKQIPARLLAQAREGELSLEARVAALFTYAQVAGADGIGTLLELTDDADLAEFALRAAGDRLPWIEEAGLDIDRVAAFLKKGTARQKVAAMVALGRTGDPKAATALLRTPYEFPREKVATAPVGEPVLVKGSRRPFAFETNLAGYRELHLHTLYYHVGEKSDRTHWLNPVIHMENGEELSLLDLDWKSAETDNGPVLKVRDAAEMGLAFNEKTMKGITESLGMPVVGSVVFDLPRGASRFTARVTMVPAESGDGPQGEFHATPDPFEGLAKRSVHATPDSGRVLPHLAVQSLVRIQAVDAILGAMDSGSADLAHWAARYMHDEALVDGVLRQLKVTEIPAERRKVVTTLARLYHQEAPYDGSWWWTTRPDTRGPYYKPVTWSGSGGIKAALENEWDKSDTAGRAFLTTLNDSHRLGIEKFGTFLVKEEEEETELDLNKILSKKGAIATMALEDVLLSLDTVKGKAGDGRKLFTSQGCVSCHTIDGSQQAIGPFMGQIGSIMKRDQIAEAILRPNATISQGFQTSVVSTTDGGTVVGFVTGRNAEEITLRDMTGKATSVAVAKVRSEEHLPTSMMPPGLANSLSVEEFASLVAFLEAQK